MKIGIELTAPWLPLWAWAAVPLGLDPAPAHPEDPPPEAERLFRASNRAFAGDPRAFPGQRALDAAADLLVAKRLFRALGLATPPFGRVRNAGELEALGLVHGWPALLRAPDGRVVRRIEGPGEAPAELEGRYVYERALDYEAEVLVLAAFQDGRLEVWPAAERVEGGWVAPYDAPKTLPEALERLFLALGHEGVLELRAGVFEGRWFFWDFVPYPTARSWLFPLVVEAHVRAAFGWPIPHARGRGHVALVEAKSEAAARAHPDFRPFFLDRPYIRLGTPDRAALTALVERAREG